MSVLDRAFVGVQKVRYVKAVLQAAAEHRESLGLKKDAHSLSALSDMLGEALDEMGVRPQDDARANQKDR